MEKFNKTLVIIAFAILTFIVAFIRMVVTDASPFGCFGFLILIGVMLYLLVTKKGNLGKNEYIILATLFVFYWIGAGIQTDTEPQPVALDQKAMQQKAEEQKNIARLDKESVKQQALEKKLTFTGDMNVTTGKNNIFLTIKTNLPDGAIIEISVINGDLENITEYVTIKNKTAQKNINIPASWKPGYIGVSPLFSFEENGHPQPDHIKKLYGKKGENLLGTQTKESVNGGKNGFINHKNIPYPNQQAVDNESKRIFAEIKKQIIDASNGIIIDIKPRYEDWKMTNVIVSDSWYHSEKYEQERFVKLASEMVVKLVDNAELIKEENQSTRVYFVDTYGKDLATPKILGGYNIKD